MGASFAVTPGTGVPGGASTSSLIGVVVSTVVVVVVTGAGVIGAGVSVTGAVGSVGGFNGGTPGSGRGGSARAEPAPPATSEHANTRGSLSIIDVSLKKLVASQARSIPSSLREIVMPRR